MIETKWTPGPWRKNKYGSVGAGNYGTLPVIAIVESEFGNVPLAAQYAYNANLIAAAPELYDALVEAIDELDQICVKLDGENYNRPRFNAVLAKARGDTP